MFPFATQASETWTLKTANRIKIEIEKNVNIVNRTSHQHFQYEVPKVNTKSEKNKQPRKTDRRR